MVLLAVLATTVLAALAVPLRARLAWILVAIAVYVPVAGAGASIQLAGVMVAAGVIASLAGRPASRWYALLLAACAQSAPLPDTDKPLELLAVRTLDGTKYDPAALAGKVVVINFWSPG